MLKSVSMRNYLGFAGEAAELEFCGGVNVIIGENGTGKTALLKLLYAFLECKPEDKALSPKISEMFDWNTTENLFSFGADEIDISIADETKTYLVTVQRQSKNVYSEDYLHKTSETPSVFIPSKEMLSHSRGLIAMSRKMRLPFDRTLLDIVMNAELPEAKAITPDSEALLKKIAGVIRGETVFKNEAFYVVRDDGQELIYSFEAEGMRKFGLLWKLIRNGLFEAPGSILLWDEPESSLNPELIPKLVDILLDLQRTGVQIFIATHEYNLVRYIDIMRESDDEVLFHHLRRNGNGSVSVHSSADYSAIDSPLDRADAALYDTVIEKAMSGNG